MKKYNNKSIITGLLTIIAGGVLVYFGRFQWISEQSLLIGIGCSLLASGLVILLQALLVEVKTFSYAEDWGLTKIYNTRAEMNADTDGQLINTKETIDIVAFGLKSFRDRYNRDVQSIVNRGVNIRILSMNPSDDNSFLNQREKEEHETIGQIRNSIQDLVIWADEINRQAKSKRSGSITIKGYKCMTLDFYWRADDVLYVGPYWYGRGSQQTITYKFVKGKKGFELYSGYFDELWEDSNNTVLLTKPTRQILK